MEELEFLLDWPFWVFGGVSSGFTGLEGEFMIAVRPVRYWTYVEKLERSVIWLKN